MKFTGDYDWPLKNPDHKPFESQKTTTGFLLCNKRAYVLSEMRTGKTLSVLWALDLLFKSEKIKKVLVVAPLTTLRLVWAKEIFENLPHLRYAIAHGTRNDRIRAIRSDAQVVIINHDGIKVCPDEIVNEGMDILIIDEMTAFKNATADRSKVMQKIAKSFKAVWGLSGNPTPNSPSEAFGQAKIVNPSNPFLPPYFTKFKQMVEMEIAPFMWIPRPEAKEVVHKVLQPSIRFERDQCFDIPPMVHRTVEIEMSKEQQKAYEEMKKQLYIQYDNGEITAVNAGVKATKLLQISAGAVKDDNGNVLYLDDSPKVKYILDVFENDLGRGKLIVVSAFRASVEKLREQFRKEKIRCDLIYGQISLNERTAIINDFQHGKLQILVVQPQAVSHGLCFDATNFVIWHSLVASGEVYGQMIDRIISASQKKKQYNEYLIGSKADKHIYDILTNKKDFSSAVLEMFSRKTL